MKKILNLIFLMAMGLFIQVVFANGDGVYQSKGISSILSRPYESSFSTITLFPGSLKSNIERLAKNNDWVKVVWLASEDYQLITTVRIKAANFIEAMQSVLKNYPLQAVFYKGNRVLVIKPRTIR